MEWYKAIYSASPHKPLAKGTALKCLVISD